MMCRRPQSRRSLLLGAGAIYLPIAPPFPVAALARGGSDGGDHGRGGHNSTVGDLLASTHTDSSGDGRDASLCWQKAGLLSRGGIPNRTQIHKTLAPLGRGQNDSAQINAAIATCPANQVVMLGPGTFTITPGNFIQLWKNNITLRGSGAGQTRILRNPGSVPNQMTTSSNPSPCILISVARWHVGAGGRSANLTADAPSDSYSITVDNTAGFAVGVPILIDEASGAGWMPSKPWGAANTPSPPGPNTKVWASPDYRVTYRMHNSYYQYVDDPNPAAFSWFMRYDRPTNEMKMVTAISGNTITFDSPLAMTYRVSNRAQATYYVYADTGGTNSRAFVTNSGVEAMTLSNGDDNGLMLGSCSYCWAKDVEVVNTFQTGIDLQSCFRCEIERCYIHDAAWPLPGGGGYNISMSWGCSECLIHNNISVRCNKVMVARSCGTGSVIAYNYMDQGYIRNAMGWQEIGLNASHMVGPHHVLFEGNWCFNFDQDCTHGNSIYMTGFRNQITGLRGAFVSSDGATTWSDTKDGGGPHRCIGGMVYTYWLSAIGNVCGVPGVTTAANGWVYSRPLGFGKMPDNSILGLGWEATAPQGVDPDVATNAIINGNWDFLQNQQTWDSGGPKTLPDSFYLTQAPPYFHGLTWPWVDPSTGKTYTLPAKARYDAGTPI